MNEIAADALYSLTFIDVPLYDKNIYKRFYIKVKEFNQSICNENDEVIREEKWQTWVNKEKQQFPSTNEVNDIAIIGSDEFFDTKVRR